MLAREGSKTVIRVDMQPPQPPPHELDEDEAGRLQAHVEVARDMERAEQALARGDIEGAMAIFKAAKDKAKQLFQKGKEAAKKAASKASEVLKKATAPQHIVVEMSPEFMHHQERMLGFIEKLYEKLTRLIEGRAAKEPDEAPAAAAPEEDPSGVPPDEAPATATAEPARYYILRSTKA